MAAPEVAPPEVVLSGFGVVTPYGVGVPAFTEGLAAGRVAIGPLTGRGPALEGGIAGQGPPVCGPRKQSYLDRAVVEALSAAALPALPGRSLVVFVGQAGWARIPGHGPDWAEFAGPAASPRVGPPDAFFTHACASAAFALGFARRMVRSGAADVVLIAGANVLNRYEYQSMQVVRALSPQGARPFDAERDGVVLGEGGGAVVVEAAEHARRRGAPADIVVAGVAGRLGGAKPAASDPGLIEEVVTAALTEAGVDRIGHVHAHATGTPQGDAAELAALESIAERLQQPALPVTSHKGAIGHLLHTSALPSLIAAAMTLRTGVVPPVAGLRRPDPLRRVVLGAEPVPAASPATAVVNSLGFGGNNASVVLTRRPG